MSKTSACIAIIQILNSKEIASKIELGEMLEINPRNIPEYIKEIEMSGYKINTVRGIYGGYKLDKSSMLPAVKLTLDEKKILHQACDFLNKSPEFLDKNAFNMAAGKVLGTVSSNTETSPITMVDRFPLQIDKNILRKRYNDLEDAIQSQTKIEIEYMPSHGHLTKHIIHPYKNFVYNSNWFVIAWNETVNDFAYFKLNRIEKITPLRMHFSIMKTYDEREYVDSYGLKQYGESIHIVLEFKDVFTAINERTYGKNQKIEKIDDHWLRLSCDMQNKDMIKSFILSWGNKCKVIEPEWLKEEIKNDLISMIDLY